MIVQKLKEGKLSIRATAKNETELLDAIGLIVDTCRKLYIRPVLCGQLTNRVSDHEIRLIPSNDNEKVMIDILAETWDTLKEQMSFQD